MRAVRAAHSTAEGTVSEHFHGRAESFLPSCLQFQIVAHPFLKLEALDLPLPLFWLQFLIGAHPLTKILR